MTPQHEWSRILIVHDGQAQLNDLARVFGEEGLQVVNVATAAEALERAKHATFAVAVVGLALPEDLFTQFLHLLKTRNGRIRIILHSASGKESFYQRAANESGMEEILTTSSPSETLGHVRRILRDQLIHYTRELEAALAERNAVLEGHEQNFRQLVEQSKEVFWVSAPDHSEMYYVSPLYETIWGRSCSSLFENPRSLWEAIHPQDQERLLTHHPQADVMGFDGECRIVRPDNSIRWVRTRTFPLRNPDGEIFRLAGVAEDITEQRRIEEALINSERQFRQSSRMEAIGTLAGGIAHDFNNILTAIMGYTELALATVPKGSRTQRNLQEVLTAGHRAKHLVLQILTFSRQAGQGKKPIPLHMVIREALNLLRATIPSTIEIRQSVKTEATILADPVQMHQVIINICTNAEYAMRETGGILKVALEDVQVTEKQVKMISGLQVGPYIRLTVKDTGSGMTSEVLERIFDPFFTTKPIGEGSGMGMAVVHGIVTGHGGAIVANSVMNKGTKIEVYLPIIPSPGLERMADQGPIPVGKETILFVDDEETIVHLGKELLTQLGYTVEIYTSSVEALNAFRQNPSRFDLVMTDQTMPGLTGEALSRELLRIRPDLPIILCTGFSHIMSAEKAKGLGIQAYLMKPLAIRDLAPIIRHVLDKTPSPLAGL